MLVVDDNADVRKLLVIVFDEDPHVRIAGEATNGQEGVQLAAELQPDIVVLDLNMPVRDGLSALPEIRTLCPNAKIVIWTASVFEEAAEAEALAMGADAFIAKGGRDPVHIVRYIREQCSRRHAG